MTVIRKHEDLPSFHYLVSGRPEADTSLSIEGKTARSGMAAIIQIIDKESGKPSEVGVPADEFFRNLRTGGPQGHQVQVIYLMTPRFYENRRQVRNEHVEFTKKVGELSGGASNFSAKPKNRIVTESVLDLIHEEAAERKSRVGSLSKEEISRAQARFKDLCQTAMNEGASDIHIEVQEGAPAQILFRVDGQLQKYYSESKEAMDLVCRAAYGTLTERGSINDEFSPKKYQNAPILMDLDQGKVRLRYASLPVAPNGYNVVLRLLPIGVQSKHKTFPELGYSMDQAELIERGFGRASGVVIITGVTGSGKSTTLHNAMEEIATSRPTKKIRTLEEPVETNIRGASQTPILRSENDKDSASPFTNALKACMRADPDVLMVGEIRDKETAELAFQASQTGHQVATTLHTQSWIGVADRLRLMGISYGEIAQPGLLSALIYQALLPVLCEHCRIPADQYTPHGHLEEGALKRLRSIATEEERRNIYFKGPGCSHCNGRGTVGRTICAEVALVTNAILRRIAKGDIMGAIEVWRNTRVDEPGDMTGRWASEHALWKMRQGLVSPLDVEEKFQFLDEIGKEDEE